MMTHSPAPGRSGQAPRRTRSLPALFLVALATAAAARGAVAQADRTHARLQIILDKRTDEHRQFTAEIDEIARTCDALGDAESAAEIRGLALPLDPGGLSIATLPEAVQPELPADLPDAERAWRTQLRQAREAYARRLYSLSRELLNAGFPTSAYQLVREVAAYDADHALARRILGYERYQDHWVTPFAARQLRGGNVWHDEFGWLPKDRVARYGQGERYFRGRWMPAAQEEAIRRDFQQAWHIETDHYLVKTNHSLERGVEIARMLEDYYRFFSQTFAGFFQTKEQMQRLFRELSSGGRRTAASSRFVVHFYRGRDEYVDALAAKIPQVGVTNGAYYPPDRVVYAYDDGEDGSDATLFHEASHQYFYECTPRNRPIGETAHFWIVEGIACYMESYKNAGGRISLGDPRFVRFWWARRRVIDEDWHVPLEQFAAMGMREFQDGDQQTLQRRYSEASGLAQFLMHYDGGRYREALIDYLAQIYSPVPRRQVDSLAELTGVPFRELDRQYVEYVRELAQRIDGPNAGPER